MKIFILFVLLMCGLWALAQGDRNVAKVTMLRGTALIKAASGEKSLKQDDWVSQGDIIATKDKSFVKITFTDKSTMNVGPNSEVNINKFGGGEAGLISVIKGQIRSQVTKDILKQAEDKSKVVIKTKTAAMGIRGTDFLVSYSPETEKTNLITFEGNVAMAQINPSEANFNNTDRFEAILNDPSRVVAVTDGLYAGAGGAGQGHVTIPTKISPVQFESLKQNENLEEKAPPAGSSGTSNFKEVVPPGLSAKTVTNENSKMLDAQVKPQIGATDVSKEENKLPPPEGMVDQKTGAVAPTAGGFVDLKTGLYVAPPPGSKFDANAGVYVPPRTLGTVDQTGQYKAPEGLKLNTDGRFVPVDPAPGASSEGTTAPKTNSGASTQTAPAPVAIPIKPQVMSTTPMLVPLAPIASATGTMLPPPPPKNDVLGGGFFVPGNYFIDGAPIAPSTQIIEDTRTKVQFTIQSN